MPAIVVCAACQTKLKVPDGSTAKALRCPRCKGIVPVAPAPPPEPPKEEEFEVNEAIDEQEEEHEVNEAVDEQEEGHEVNEAVDEDEDEEEDDDDSPLVELGFPPGKDPFKLAEIPEPARKAIQKAFVKNEKALWASRPSQEMIESKAWLGFVVAGVTVIVALLICLATSAISFVTDNPTSKIVTPILGLIVALAFLGVGAVAVIFRKNIGGNVAACYVVSNKRAYIFDGNAVRAFTPVQLAKLKCEESAKFAGAGDLIFAYDFMGNPGVQVDREQVEAAKTTGAGNSSTPVGFLNIKQVQLVRLLLHDLLIDPGLKKAQQKRKKSQRKYFE